MPQRRKSTSSRFLAAQDSASENINSRNAPMAPALEPYLLQSPMRTEHRDVDDRPDRQREQ
jgi:hypothetical protein